MRIIINIDVMLAKRKGALQNFRRELGKSDKHFYTENGKTKAIRLSTLEASHVDCATNTENHHEAFTLINLIVLCQV